VYIFAYRIYPSGKYLTLAIKPNVNYEKDDQGDVGTFQNRVNGVIYIVLNCMIQLGYTETLDSNIP
jgi:hypothetical protein